MNVNSAANSIVVQDTQAHIHRMAEIIKVLDTSLAASAVIKVYPLKFTDAKALATIIQNVFQPQSSRSGGGNGAADLAVLAAWLIWPSDVRGRRCSWWPRRR